MVNPKIKLRKFNNSTNDVIFIDGLWGSGKSMLAPVIGAMEGVEKYKSNPIYEYICCLSYLNKISDDACASTLQTYADMDQYYNVIGRAINLRWSDDSGFKNNPNSWRYITRLFGGEGDHFVQKINKNNLALFIMSHNVSLTSDPLFDAYGSRLKLIHIVRHPCYIFTHWKSYLGRFDGPREFTISFDIDGEKVPWFWRDQAEIYPDLSIDERAAQSIIMLYGWLFDSLDKLQKRENNFMVCSFEDAIFQTDHVMDKLSEFLARKHSRKINEMLKKQKIPRASLNSGKGHIFYGFKESSSKDESYDYKLLTNMIAENVSAETMKKFDVIVDEYNKRFPSKLCNYR